MNSNDAIIHHSVVHTNKESRTEADFSNAVPLPIPVLRRADFISSEKIQNSNADLKSSILVFANEPPPKTIEKIAGTVPPPKRYQFPYHAVGKLLMTAPDGQSYVGSGFMVANDLILTAGHCVHSGPGGGGYFKNIRFRPGHPWAAIEVSARLVAVFDKWTAKGDFAYDFAFFKTDYPILLDGTLGITITEQGVPSGSRNAEGYPAAPPFEGVLITEAISDTRWGGFPSKSGWYTMKDNNMTGGASGGPWINSATAGQVEGLNSFKFDDAPAEMNSPFFGPSLRDLYNTIAKS